MVDKGALNMKDIRILWKSNLISNGPNVVRKDLPQELKDLVRGIMVGMPLEDKKCFESTEGGEVQAYVPITHKFYEPIIKMRAELKAARRG